MKCIITEVIIPRTERTEYTYAPQRIKIRIGNEGGDNRLDVEGINDEPILETGETAHEMYFENESQIDEFAKICKNLLSNNEGNKQS